jgi:ATP-dependent DNA helicase DinG
MASDKHAYRDIREFLGAESPLMERVPGFSVRPGQQTMADAIASAMADGERLIVEAGTGTGKTFAYLMPALASGKKVVISTGTRHLQDQLYNRDLPVIRDVLGSSASIALLKGRTNYLCHHRLEIAVTDGGVSAGRQAHELASVRAWSAQTTTGDIVELTDVPEDSKVWPRVTSTIDNCLGQECEYLGECCVVKARRKAMDADLVVINHHLLFADMAIKEEGFGELLPEVDAFIIDEAHQLNEVATQFFGSSLSSHQLHELARDTQAEHIKEAGDMADLPDAALKLDDTIRKLRLALGRHSRRASWADVAADEMLKTAMGELMDALRRLSAWLEIAAERGKGLDSCWQRCLVLISRLESMQGEAVPDYIHWFETGRVSFRLYRTPLNVAPVFRSAIDTLAGAWIFTSATLAIGDSFQHYAAGLGLEDARTLLLNSPYDFRKNALLYLPPAMPEPNSDQFQQAVVDCVREVIAASEGRAFVLFTSHAALRFAAGELEGELDYPLLVQGSAPRQELLQRFRELGNAVLLGTSSFWEGVDVRGDALSCVIVDRLPFASPGDPVLQARIEALRQQGMNPFMEYQLPKAVIALKQGIGRLIRDETDRGVLVICDPRLRTKSYGRIFLNSLPPMPVSTDLDNMHEFFAGVEYTSTESIPLDDAF